MYVGTGHQCMNLSSWLSKFETSWNMKFDSYFCSEPLIDDDSTKRKVWESFSRRRLAWLPIHQFVGGGVAPLLTRSYSSQEKPSIIQSSVNNAALNIAQTFFLWIQTIVECALDHCGRHKKNRKGQRDEMKWIGSGPSTIVCSWWLVQARFLYFQALSDLNLWF